MILDDFKRIEELDPEGMVEDLDGFPEQCAEAVSIGKDLDLPVELSNYSRVVVTGMGGSAISGDLLGRLVDIPVITNRGYNLPKNTGPGDLLIGISYSGNTEETLSAIDQGVNRGMKTLCLSTDGAMEEYAKKRALPLIKIPTGHQPRASTGYILFPLLVLFQRSGLAGTLNFEDLLDRLTVLRDKWNSSVETKDNRPKQLAREFSGKVPIIYGTKDNTQAVAFRWKTQVNENAKQPAYWNYFPELNHNETVGYELMGDLMENGKVALLRNDFDLEKNKTRMDIMRRIFDDEGIEYSVIDSPRGDKFTQIIGHIYLGDYFSVYLALLNGVDPSPVRLIEEFKKLLKENS